MSEHAPGPWTVDKAQVLLGTQDGDEVSDSMGNRVCEVSHLSTKLANARLIAAAPELLEALKGILDSYEAYLALNESKPEDQWDEYDCAFLPKWRAAQAAIKKATGE